MTDINPEDFIDGFFEHAGDNGRRDKEAVKRYNREYYLRTRKLKGRQTGDSKAGRSKPLSSREMDTNQRRQIAAEKVARARLKANNVKDPSKRARLKRKLDRLERKLRGKKAKPNPYAGVRSNTKSKGLSPRDKKRLKEIIRRTEAAKKKARNKPGARFRRAEGAINRYEKRLQKRLASRLKKEAAKQNRRIKAQQAANRKRARRAVDARTQGLQKKARSVSNKTPRVRVNKKKAKSDWRKVMKALDQ